MSRLLPPAFLRPPLPQAADTAFMPAAYPAVRERRAAGFALAAASHLLLAWFLSAYAPSDRHAQAPARSGPEIQWLLPKDAPARTLATVKPEPAAPAPRQLPARRQVTARTDEPVSIPIASAPEPAPEPAPAEALPQQQEAPSTPLDPARLVRDLKLAGMASGLDAKGKGREAASMTLEAKLAAGIERAHAGDKGWLTSNGFEEISSTENTGTRVYRMRSVFGTFCVYVTEGKPPVSGKCR